MKSGFQLSEILYPVKLSIPVAMAYIPLGAALGLYLTSSGIHWYWAPISALIIFAGSIEFLVVSFILASMPLYQVAWIAFIVNFRHIFYGLSFPMHLLKNKFQKAYGVFSLTDETYAILSSPAGKSLKGFQITILGIISQIWWTGGALIGCLAGNLIPTHIKGFEFSLTSMFLILAMDAIKANQNLSLVLNALVSCIIGFIFDKYLYSGSFLIVGLLSYLAILTWEFYKTKRLETHG